MGSNDKNKKRIFFIIMAALVLVTVMEFYGHDENLVPEKTEPVLIRFAIHDFTQALNGQNVDELLEFYSADFREASPGEPDIVGTAAVRKYYENLFNRYDLTLADSVEEILYSGDFAAVRVSYVYRHQMALAGRSRVYQRQRTLEIWERGPAGQWRIKRRYIASIEVK